MRTDIDTKGLLEINVPATFHLDIRGRDDYPSKRSHDQRAGMTTPSSVPTISDRWARLIRFIYDHFSSKVYDRLQFLTKRLKDRPVNELGLKRGEHVIVFCCGTGQEFSFILEHIGPEGEILGVDWSDGMLAQARRKIADNGWTNVKAVKADVTALSESVVQTASYDAAICTLSLAIISEPDKAFQAMKNAVRPGGRIVISDVCSFSGLKSVLNPFVILMDLGGGNTRRSLARSRVFAEALPSHLSDVKLKWYLARSYYIASGTVPDPR
jgi:ubiquinone/menaquinone biosynthesis C-methylase UbiE